MFVMYKKHNLHWYDLKYIVQKSFESILEWIKSREFECVYALNTLVTINHVQELVYLMIVCKVP
jgi:hypothetical protein